MVIAGGIEPHYAAEQEGELRAVAVVVERPGQAKVAIVACDVLWVPRDLADAAVAEITRFAGGVGQAHDHVLVLGIGGSALGTRALLEALRGPAWNELDDEAREFWPRLTVLDNVDPASVAAALRRIDPRRVLVNVVSKSGGTAETMAQYLVVRAWLEEALGAAAARHLVFTTDPERGALRELARREGIAALDVPPGVGGRFSVLSPVGPDWMVGRPRASGA